VLRINSGPKILRSCFLHCLHILIGAKYLILILRLQTLGFLFFVEKESTEADFAIRAMKCTFCGDGACKAARHILDDKNKALKHANPTGQFPTDY